MQCSLCEWYGDETCPECKGDPRGVTIDVCPRTLITPDIWDLLDAAYFAKRGTWPVAGGWLDQTFAAVAGIRQVWDETENWQRELGGSDGK